MTSSNVKIQLTAANANSADFIRLNFMHKHEIFTTLYFLTLIDVCAHADWNSQVAVVVVFVVWLWHGLRATSLQMNEAILTKRGSCLASMPADTTQPPHRTS